MAKHYSPLRYPGGKAKLARFLTAVLHRNGRVRPEYVEPYAGGAGIALQLLFEEYVDRVVINDADPRLRSFWWAVSQRTREFIELLRTTPVTVDAWHRQREIYARCDFEAPLRLGFATFFLNRTSRSGIVHNSGPIGGYDQTGNYKIDARYNSRELVKRIVRIGAYADRIETKGEDGQDLLESLAKDRERAKRAFVYLDPPYYAKGRALYMNHFTRQQHESLAAFLQDSPGFDWILTYDDVSSIRRLYEGFSQLSFSLSYSAYERRLGSELLIYPSSVSLTAKERIAFPFPAVKESPFPNTPMVAILYFLMVQPFLSSTQSHSLSPAVPVSLQIFVQQEDPSLGDWSENPERTCLRPPLEPQHLSQDAKKKML